MKDINGVTSNEWSWHPSDICNLIMSEEFEHDVGLQISGDFGDDTTLIDYKDYVTKALNRFNDDLLHMGGKAAFDLACDGKLKPVEEKYFNEDQAAQHAPIEIRKNAKMYQEWFKGFKAFATT